MKIATRNENIRRTVRAWDKLGLDIYLTGRQFHAPSGRLITRNDIVRFEGKGLTFGEFAKRFPYAANPST